MYWPMNTSPIEASPEVDAAQAAGDRAEQRAREAREPDRAEHGQPRRQAEPVGLAGERRVGRLAGQVAVRVGADRHEERVRERQLAGDADQQREPDRRDRGRHREQAGLQPEAREEVRHDQQDDQGADHPSAPDSRSDTADLRRPEEPGRPPHQDDQQHDVGNDLAQPRPRNESSSW
jgi:hypothetical protein